MHGSNRPPGSRSAAKRAGRCRGRPLTLRPKRLSVTQIETLRRDPYALYAEKILRLKQLDPLGGASGVARSWQRDPCRAGALCQSLSLSDLCRQMRAKYSRAILREALAVQLQDADFAALQWPRLEKTIDFYLGFEARRRDKIKTIKTEADGKLDIGLADGSSLPLTARADRIELNTDGTVTLVDYKTGAPPGNE